MTDISVAWPSALAESARDATGGRSIAASGAHIVLLGLPGAGKSTVGPIVARALVRAFVDLDLEIERREGLSVEAIFAASGEGKFRAVERRLTAELLAAGGPAIVLAPGGGWAEESANRALLGAAVFAVYLRVTPRVAVGRMGAQTEARPLLAGGDPERKLVEVLARREPLYLQAQYTVNVDHMSPEQVASSIVALASGEFAD